MHCSRIYPLIGLCKVNVLQSGQVGGRTVARLSLLFHLSVGVAFRHVSSQRAPLRKHLPAELAQVTRLLSLFHQNRLHLRSEHAQETVQSLVYALKGTVERGAIVLPLSKDP